MSDESWKQFLMSMRGKPYRPSNGMEGDIFFAGWCSKCWFDRITRLGEERWDEGCPLIANSMAYNIGDPEYPKEWKYQDDTGEPTCTKFRDEARGEPRDENAAVGDLFSAPGSA